MNETKIKSSIRHFLQANTNYDLNYSLSKANDSDYYYTVEVKSNDLSFTELFDLARNLNRKAVKEELRFIIIAGR